LTLATGILFGLVPAIRGSRSDLERSLRGSGQAGSRSSFGRVPGSLVIVEVAFSVILLVGAALMIRTLAKLEAIELGFDPSGLIAMHVDLPTDRYTSTAARIAFFETLIDRLRSVPGISDAAVAYGAPPSLGGFSFGTPEAEGSPARPSSVIIPFNTVTPGYFQVLRMPLLSGRNFSDREADDVMIVSRGFADRFWPDGSAVGRRFRMGPNSAWRTIIGIVPNVEARAAGRERTTMQVYYPWALPRATPATTAAAPRRRSYDWRLLIVRAGDPMAALPHITAEIRRLDPNQPIERLALVQDLYAEAFARQRFVLLVLGSFAAIALILTAAGIFGVLSHAVAERTREIGIRMALGASPRHVLCLFLSRGMTLAIVGAVLGLGGALVLSRALQTLLFEVGPSDPLSFVGVAVALITVALAACWFPTRAATHVHPAVALRVE
jgi:predicted permease